MGPEPSPFLRHSDRLVFAENATGVIDEVVVDGCVRITGLGKRVVAGWQIGFKMYCVYNGLHTRTHSNETDTASLATIIIVATVARIAASR